MRTFLSFLFCAMLAWPLLGKDYPVTVSVVVTPAYTPFLYRHHDHVVLTVTNRSDQPQYLKFRGAISGDYGFSARTKEGFQPVSSFKLLAYQTRSLVVSSSKNLGFLDEGNLDILIPKGMQDLLNQGYNSPEGSYELCVQAWQYDNADGLPEPLSEEVCFPFSVANTQPPQTVMPFCGDTVRQQYPVFSWSLPGGMIDPSRIRYDLYLLKLQAGQNPEEALRQAVATGAGNPLVKTELSGTSYALQPADAPFLGKDAYAWCVVAKDLDRILSIENGGQSNACTFVYGFAPVVTPQDTTKVNPPIVIEKNTTVKGRLFYTYPEGTVPLPPGGYTLNYYQSASQIIQSHQQSSGGTILNSGAPGYTPEVAADLNDVKGVINNMYAYMPPLDKAYPLAGVRVKLQLHLIRRAGKTDGHSMTYIVNQTVGEGVTDDKGNFAITFLNKDSIGQITKVALANGAGPYYLPVLKLLVLDKHYCSPELNIEATPGGTADVGNVVSFVRSYDLDVKPYAHLTTSSNKDNKITESAPIPNMILTVGRKKFIHSTGYSTEQKIIDPGHPVLEGDFLNETGTGSMIAIGGEVPVYAQTDLQIFSRQTTDKNGLAHFTRLTGLDEPITCQFQATGENSDYSVIGGNGQRPEFTPSGFASYQTATSVFNRDYYRYGTPKQTLTDFFIWIGEANIKGRVVEKIQGSSVDTKYLQNCMVKLYSGNFMEKFVWTGADGRFDFGAIAAEYSYGNSIPRRVSISQTGYKTAYYPSSTGSTTLQYGELRDLGEIQLIPNAQIRGIVKDEYGNELPCYVRINGGPWYETNLQDANTFSPFYGFKMYSVDGASIQLEIQPKSSSYFPKTFKVNVNTAANIQNLGTFVLYERLHRVKIAVQNQAGARLANASVNLEEFDPETNAHGEVLIKFPSPGTQFYLRVGNVPGYAPTEMIITNNPSERDTTYLVTLTQSIRLTGKVVAGADLKPVDHAHVVVNSGGKEFEAYTDAQGYYELTGIPRTGNIWASKESAPNQPLYVGQYAKWYAFTDPANTSFTQDFNLTVRNDLALKDIWGFKAELATFAETSPGVYRCTGALTEVPVNENFGPKAGVERVPFGTTFFKKSSETDSLGRFLIEPSATAVNLSWYDWKLKVYDRYDATLKDPSGSVLKVQKNDGKGVIGGYVSSDLESFRFSYQYDGQFYLGESASDIVIPVFKAKEDYPYRSFNLANRDNTGQAVDPAFKVRMFPATGLRDSSFVSRDSGYIIRAMLHTAIPGIEPSDLRIDVGNIVVTNEGIQFKKGPANRIKFGLEQWRFEATADWEFDMNQEGIGIPSGNLYTGVVDPVLNNILIKPTFFEVDVNNVGGFTLGGVAAFVPDPTSFRKLFYDPYDKHYQLWFLNTGARPAGTAVLPNLPEPVAFNNFTINSVGGFVPSMMSKTMRYFDIVDLCTDGISISPGRINLASTIFLGLNPEVGIPVNFVYTKPAGPVVYTMNIGGGKFETSGNAAFEIKSLHLQQGLCTADGILKVRADATTGAKDFQLNAHFTKRPDAIFIDVDGPESTGSPRQLVAMGNGRGLSVQRGRQNFTGNSWENLAFDAYFQGFTNVEQKSLNRYVVHGAIDMNDGKLEVTNIETPFGGLKVVLDFDKPALHGALSIENANFNMAGIITLKSLDCEMDMDGQGFLLYGNAKGDLATVITNVGTGFMIGYYDGLTQDQKNAVLRYSLNHEFPSNWVGNTFGGVYLNASKVFIDESLDFDPLPLDGHIYAAAQIDAMLDLVNLQCRARVGVTASAEASIDLWLCEVCVGAAGEVVVSGDIGAQGANIHGCGTLNLGVNICEIEISGGAQIRFDAGTDNGLDAKISFGDTGSCGISNPRSPCAN